jgi:hypothetical protein
MTGADDDPTGGTMPILVIAEVPGQTAEMYDGMLAALGTPIRQAKGFIAHFAAATDTGWRVMELWDTQDDANRFFATHVHPHLPPGIKPRRSFQALHSLVQK